MVSLFTKPGDKRREALAVLNPAAETVTKLNPLVNPPHLKDPLMLEVPLNRLFDSAIWAAGMVLFVLKSTIVPLQKEALGYSVDTTFRICYLFMSVLLS